MAVWIAVVEVVVAAALFQAGYQTQAGVALTLGLWMLGRALRPSE